MQVDSYLHTHLPGSDLRSLVNINSSFEGIHLINIHSIYMYCNFRNIDSNNNVFFYTPASSIVIPTGNYNLISFNKYLLSIPATALY